MRTAVFTIASRNYFAFVRTLMKSLEKTNPQWDRFVGVADEIGEEFEKLPKNFNYISLKEMNLPESEKMIFRYTILEFNTAIKPFVFKLLFNKMGYDRVIYLDPDIYVYEPLTEIEKAFDRGNNIILTPHLTGLWHDIWLPNEESILQAGTYNLGFLGLAKGNDSSELLEWWGNKLEYKCLVSVENGIFVDQKWMDLVPGLFEKVFILRDEGYNIAYWNLSHRIPEKKKNKFYFNGQLLKFFHFSGLNPNDIGNVSKHQNRFTIKNVGIVKELLEEYAKEVLSNDYDLYKGFKYKYNEFLNGKKICDLFRYAYRENMWLQKACGKDPFDAYKVFENEKAKIIAYLLDYVWKIRPDVQKVYPNPESQEYINWFRISSVKEYGLDEEYLKNTGIRIENKKSESTHLSELSSKENLSFFKKFVFFLQRHLSSNSYLRIRKIYRWFIEKDKSKTVILERVEEIDNSGNENERLMKKGINLIGYIKSEHGVGEACRHTAECIEKIGIDWSIYDYEVGNICRKEDRRWQKKISEEIMYNVSIFNINADQMYVAKEHLPREAWNGYKIGIWYWELQEFPDEWLSALDLVDEIWAPTRFIADSISMKARCPVIYMPPSIVLEESVKAERKEFKLPESAFLFLTMYDSLSFQSRKNPQAVIKAFREAFNASDKDVGLVIKINNASMTKEEIDGLAELKGNYDNIYIITDILSREKINELINTCDVAISLHRSEGLGLLCQEAMYFGKPVIATNWSGNIDFMNNDIACMVDYELKQIGCDIGPYKAHQLWAEADYVQAANYMKKLFSNREYYNSLSIKAKKSIRENFSPERCARRMKQRLEYIYSVIEEMN